jgi:hypothetical protein
VLDVLTTKGMEEIDNKPKKKLEALFGFQELKNDLIMK